MKQASHQGTKRCADEPEVRRHIEMPTEFSPTGFVYRVLCDYGDRFLRLIWHIWWQVAPRPLPGSISPRSSYLHGATVPSISGLARHRRTGQGRDHREARAVALKADALDERANGDGRPHERNWTPASFNGALQSAPGPSPKRILVTGYGFWVFLLSDIIMFSAILRRLCCFGRARLTGGPTGRAAVSISRASRRSRQDALFALELHMWPGERSPRRCVISFGRLLGRAGDHGGAGRSMVPDALEVREFMPVMIAQGAGPTAQRLPVGFFRAGRMPRHPCEPRAFYGWER